MENKKCRNKINQTNDIEINKNLERINKKYVISEIRDLSQFDKGFFFTFYAILVNPATHIRNYLFNEREKYTKPIAFLFLTSIVYSLISYLLGESVGIVINTNLSDKKIISKIFIWLIQNRGALLLFLSFWTAYWTNLLFKKSGFNIYENCVILCYILGVVNILNSFIIIFKVLFNPQSVLILSLIFALKVSYIIYSTVSVFGKKNTINYLKVTLAFTLSVITLLTLIFVGSLLFLDIYTIS